MEGMKKNDEDPKTTIERVIQREAEGKFRGGLTREERTPMLITKNGTSEKEDFIVGVDIGAKTPTLTMNTKSQQKMHVGNLASNKEEIINHRMTQRERYCVLAEIMTGEKSEIVGLKE